MENKTDARLWEIEWLKRKIKELEQKLSTCKWWEYRDYIYNELEKVSKEYNSKRVQKRADNNRESYLDYQRKWRKSNRPKVNSYMKKYRDKNREKIREYDNRYYQNKRKNKNFNS